MLILALDTTTRGGSLALAHDGHLLEVDVGDAALTHAERLPGAIDGMLTRHRVGVADIDLFAVAAGPGSFTGLRVGIATVQGLAFSTGRPVATVSALDALALVVVESVDSEAARQENERPAFVAACMDAHRQEVFGALWGVEASGVLHSPGGPASPLGGLAVVESPTVGKPAEVFAGWAELIASKPLRIAGDGVLVFADQAAALLPGARVVRPLPPLAPLLARLAAAQASSGLVGAPHAVRPVYVRRPDAELARDRRTIPAGPPRG